MLSFLAKSRNRKAAKLFRERLLECLKPQFPDLYENHKYWDTHQVNVTAFATGFFYLGKVGARDHIERNRAKNHRFFILKGLRIKSADGANVIPFEVQVDGNLISHISISGEKFHRAFDLKTIDINEVVKEDILINNDENKKLLAIIGHVPVEQLALLEVEDTFEIELNGRKYFTILDMEDGNYIAVNKQGRVFRLDHDSNEPVQKIASSIDEFLASHNGDKETMLNRFFSIVALLLLSLATSAQLKDNGSLTLAFGPSFPMRDFGKKEPTTNSSGFSKGGAFINIAYTYPLKKRFGLTAMLHGQQNGLNTNAMDRKFKDAIYFNGVVFTNIVQPQRRPAFGEPKYPNWKFEKAHWRTANLLIGLYAKFPLSGSEKIVVTTRALTGLTYLSSPRIKGESIADSTTALVTQTSSEGLGLGYSIGAGLRYSINTDFFLLAGVDFYGTSKINIEDLTVTLITTQRTPGGYAMQQSSITRAGRQQINSINASAGIGLRF